MNERIVLDERSFKALSADSRVSILKNLNDRRRTLTELSQKLSLGSSTIKEHCDILVNADLIKQIDEGRKWKYYELTQKGKQIIHPSLMEEVKVLILLSLATIFVGGFVYLILGSINPAQAPSALQNTAEIGGETLVKTASTGMAYDSMRQNPETITNAITTEIFVAGIIVSLIIGIILGWAFTRKK